jgi:hypothetical protein
MTACSAVCGTGYFQKLSMQNYAKNVVLHRALSTSMLNFTYSSKKQVCPCGQSKSYTPLISHTSGGKCHSTKCGQKFFPPEQSYQNGNATHSETVYAYRDEQGAVLFETVRYYKNGEKSFYQRRPMPNGSYIKGLGNVRRVLYNLPEVQKAIQSQQEIFLVEGEKDCETLKAQGLLATCNPMGAGKWRKEYNEILRNAHIVILPDNDQAGKEHGNSVLQALQGIAASVKIVPLPDLPHKGDVSDWLAQGNTVEKLREIVSKTPVYVQKHQAPVTSGKLPITPVNGFEEPIVPIVSTTLEKIMATEMPPIEWLIEGLLALASFNVIAARPKQGKSWLALSMALAVSGGHRFMGKFQTTACEVLYFDLESSQRRIKQRAGIILSNSNDSQNLAGLHIATTIPRMDKGGLESLRQNLVQNRRIKLVILDTWARFWGTRRGVNAYSEDYDEGAKLQELAKELNIAIVVVHHTKKTPEDYAIDELSGTTGITAAADAIFMLRRKGDDTVFHATGRDIPNQDYATQFDEKIGQWKILGSAAEAAMSAERSLLLQLLKNYERPMKSGEIATITGRTLQATRNMLFKLKEQGLVRSPSYGVWEYIRQEQAF